MAAPAASDGQKIQLAASATAARWSSSSPRTSRLAIHFAIALATA
jgi:hypothetical protein